MVTSRTAVSDSEPSCLCLVLDPQGGFEMSKWGRLGIKACDREVESLERLVTGGQGPVGIWVFCVVGHVQVCLCLSLRKFVFSYVSLSVFPHLSN